MKLEGKVAIVTGAGRGMGRAIALTFAREGADIVIAEIDAQSAGSAGKEVESLGRRALAVPTDVSKKEQVDRCVRAALDRFNKIDILVNNTGVHKMAPAEQIAEADWDWIMDVNLKGVFLFSQAVGKQMIRQNGGKIINIASTAAHGAMLANAAYSVSKAGVIQLTKSLAMDWARHNINVNSVSPGTTMTAMAQVAENLTKELPSLEERIKTIPLRRANRPEDIANLVLFLASPESDNITGQDIVMDGGTCTLHPASVPVLLKIL